jgi:hypothetical protein
MIIFSSVDDPPLTAFELGLGEREAETIAETIADTESKPFLQNVNASSYDELAVLLQSKPVWLPQAHIERMHMVVILLTLAITLIYLTTLQLLRKFFKSFDQTSSLKAAYQATNLIVNLSCAIYGIYIVSTEPNLGLFNLDYFNSSVSSSMSSPASANSILRIASPFTLPKLTQITGYEQFAIFGAIHIAYNLWAIPLGIFYTNESPIMILHHISAIVTGSNAAYLYNGLRLHGPVPFGMCELSSVPLAIHNFLKDHYQWTKEHVPRFYQVNKFIFTMLFLTLRIGYATPHMIQIIRHAGFLLWYQVDSADSLLVLGIRIVFFTSSIVLCVLQYLWAYTIVKLMLFKKTEGDEVGENVKKEKSS